MALPLKHSHVVMFADAVKQDSHVRSLGVMRLPDNASDAQKQTGANVSKPVTQGAVCFPT